jgi:GTP-binding protein
MSTKQIRNIAIIAHVDHGKTTMVDQLLRQSGTFADHEKVVDTVMDNNAIEKERGITILAKNCAVSWKGTHINIVDTPGHADFGGEVERALSMVDGVVLLIDAQEGPMPQTRFVTKKALALGLRPILVVNKVDKPGARPQYVVNAAFDLFDKLGATDEQLDFPVVYASGINGWSSLEEGGQGEQWGPDMSALFDTILKHVPAKPATRLRRCNCRSRRWTSPPSWAASAWAASARAPSSPCMDVLVMEGPDGKSVKGRVNQVLTFQGLDRVQVTEAGPGDIVLINGIDDIGIGVTVTDPLNPGAAAHAQGGRAHPDHELLREHQPAGRPRRQVRDQPPDLGPPAKELQHNVALRVKETDEEGIFEVMGRGELHLTILLENMRREGYELAVSKPRVVFKDVDGVRHEPIEMVTADIEEQHQGGVMQALGERKGDLVNMEPDGRGRVRLEYRIPARGLIGFTNEFLNLTRGSGLISNIFDGYEPHKGDIGGRKNGVLISMDDGEIFNYALGKLDDRGRMFVRANDPVYEGMIVGIHSRDNDLVVNATRTKQLTNFRVSGKEDAIKITPPIQLTLEYGVEFIEDDELVEITPKSIRLRKRHLKEHERKRASREADDRGQLRRSRKLSQAVWLMVAVTLMWSIAGVVTRQLEHARSFEVTFWRSFFTMLSLLVILPLWQGRRCFATCTGAARTSGCPACAGA